MSDVQINTAKGFFDPSPEAGPSKGTIAVDMDDVLAYVLLNHYKGHIMIRLTMI